jgi:hypothetical protein
LVESAITSRVALSAPVRTVSSRSRPSPTLIGVVEESETRKTSFWTRTASPARVCARAELTARRPAKQSAKRKTTQLSKSF